MAQSKTKASPKRSAESKKPQPRSPGSTTAADKAKIPLVAGGAALAGVAGGAMLGAHQARRKKSTAARLGEFALQMQRARQATANGNSKQHRSPVEVVLEGLTARRPRS